ncbi:hypothetical protein I9018_24565 [Pseudomonas sp. MPFS]|uniref:hypothetical protein n=1 Tax=Pseudomonas sp. MPFS TaxID=2795724 RepID=UPI001F12C184|nr:hypothetical protein [Pseudomonas sp. MPFS]UMZ10634.1 hypothetical protein I9018_24565 [Pseudomonas sp. MPFS]
MFNRRVWLGFALAPLLPSVLFLIVFHLSDPRQAAFLLVFSVLFSYLPSLLLGIPLMVFLQSRNLLSIVGVIVCGSLLGAIVFYMFGFVFSLLLGSSKGIAPELREIVSGVLLGALVATLFSLIAGFPLLNSKTR